MKNLNQFTRDMWDEYNDYTDYEATEERLDKYNDKYLESIEGVCRQQSISRPRSE